MYKILVFLAILSAAILTGLMMTLLSVMRSMWLKQSDKDAAKGFKDFLASTSTGRILSTLSIMPVICGIVIAFIAVPNGARPIFAYIGSGVFFVGFFLWTAFFNLPIYKEVEKWSNDKTPNNGRTLIKRFHKVNIVRLLAALSTSILFFMAV